jgi:putative flippase GtrA
MRWSNGRLRSPGAKPCLPSLRHTCFGLWQVCCGRGDRRSVTVAIREALAAALPADTPVYYSSSVLMAYAVGIVLSYYGHRRFTFGGRQLANLSVSSFSLFTLIALLGLVLVTALSIAIRYGFGADQILGRYGAGFAFALATLLASIITYALNSLYTFRSRHGMVRSGR